MRLFEYQAKEVFRKYGLAVPNSVHCRTPEEALEASKNIGFPCVIKAQVLTGGRGKAGLIKTVHTPEECLSAAREILKSKASVLSGILAEKYIPAEQELYLAVTVDPKKAAGLVLASSCGGMDIETFAGQDPDKIIKEEFDLCRGLSDFQARNIAYSMGLSPEAAKAAAGAIISLQRIFRDLEAELTEINPLFVLPDGSALAGDGKILLDDNAAFRRKDFPLTREYFFNDLEYEAALEGIPYLQFSGDISLMCAGAGLATTVYDLINYEGGSVANYLEFGGPNYTKATKAMDLCLRNPSKVVLIVTFGTIARADVMASGIIEAVKTLKPDRPIVACIRGTNEEVAVNILSAAGLKPLFDTEEAVRTAVRLSKTGGITV